MFKTDVFSLRATPNRTIKIEGATLPNLHGVFFRSKQEELFRQYETARMFLSETNQDGQEWDFWFTRQESHDNQQIAVLLFREKLFEASLMFYNIIVDLSWVLCYVSAEYLFYEQNESISFEKLMSIEDSFSLLRKSEEATGNPDAPGNPFSYLLAMTPQFSPAVQLIIDFWRGFKDSHTRALYNFIKHRGKPLYKEIEPIKGPRVLDFSFMGIKCPADVRDVQQTINLEESIHGLIEFDDNILFPYISRLMEMLEKAVEPSPFIF